MGEFVVANGDPAQPFDAAEVAFDPVTRAVGRTLQRPGVAAIRLWRRDLLPAEFGGQRAHRVALVGAVGEQLRLTRYRAEPLQQPASPGRIAPVARRQGHDQREAVFQHDGVQLRRQTSPRSSRGQATRASDRLAPLLVGAPVPS